MVINVPEIKKAVKPKADSTLYNMKKEDLIEYIRTLEHNYNAAVWFNENQAKYIEQLNVYGVKFPAAIGKNIMGLFVEAKRDQEDPRTSYVETGDGLRLIFRDGKYDGFYTPNLAEVLN